MKKTAWKPLVILIGLGFFFMAGCGEKEPPSVKQSRAIAAENIDLEKELDRQDARIENLQNQYEKELEKLRKQLKECTKHLTTFTGQERHYVL